MGTKQLSAEERYKRAQNVHAAVTNPDRSKRMSVDSACEKYGISRTSYYRWLKKARDNPEIDQERKIPTASRAPKNNAKSLPIDVQEKILDMARSGNYENPRQIARELEKQNIKVSDNTVRNHLEKNGLYKLKKVTNSKGKIVNKKMIVSS